MTPQIPLFPPEGGPPARSPVVASCGIGVDSIAYLVGARARDERPDAILFANPGLERKATLRYRDLVLDPWLARVGFPPLVEVRYQVQRPRKGYYATLEEELILHGKLPSVAYGKRHTCALKWKIAPIRTWCRAWPPAQAAWAAGLPVIQVIGYDAGPRDSCRAEHAVPAQGYQIAKPLQDWGWDRERCKSEIRTDPDLVEIAAAAGMDPVPVKSACIVCIAVKPEELDEIVAEDPDAADRILRIEAAAAPRLTSIGGAWRSATSRRPASMTEYLTGKPLRTGTALPVIQPVLL